MPTTEELLDALDAAIEALAPDVKNDRSGTNALNVLRERAQWLRGWLT